MTTNRALGPRLVMVALAGLLLAGCVAPGASAPGASAPQSASPTPAMSLGISNGTTLTMTLVVNGTAVETFGPHSGNEAIPASELPPLPWVVEARSPSGRVLTSMTVHQGDVWQTGLPNGGIEYKGDAARVDLSCGRLDLWVGPPLLGPAPGGRGSPGDCMP